MSEDIVLAFLSYLGHERGRAPTALSVHLAALWDPLSYRLGLTVELRSLVLLKRGIFHQQPPTRHLATFGP